MKRALVTFFLFSSLFAAAYSQEQAPSKSATIQLAPAPNYAGTFHPAQGFIPDGGRSARVGPRVILNNSGAVKYYTYSYTDQEWIDDYFLEDLATDHTEQITDMSFTYCSSESNPNGVAVTMNFYDESIYCAGPVNWPTADCAYTLSGLPGGNNGAAACWILTLDFTGVECNLTTDTFGNQLMGWGQHWHSDNSGPVVANSSPGRTNYFTWWDHSAPNGNQFNGCYWFGGHPEANFGITLYGGPVDTNRYWAEDLGGSSTAFDNAVLDVDAEVKSGNLVTFNLAPRVGGASFDAMLLVHSKNAASAPISYMGGNALIDPSTMIQRPPGPTSQSYVVPPVSGDYYTQAAGISGGQIVGLSNGLRHQAL